MDPFDHFKHIRRLLAELRPALEQYERIQEQFRLAARSLAIPDVLREYERAHKDLHFLVDFERTTKALTAAAAPLSLDLKALAPSADFNAVSEMLRRVDRELASARFVAQLDLSNAAEDDEDEESSLDEAVVAREAEEQLVELVPADALEGLKRVDFAPLTLLDRALRNPELMRQLHAREFEGFVAALIEQLGFEDVFLTPASADGGRDVLATTRIHGISIVFAFECKKYSSDRPVGVEIARALLGTVRHSHTQATKGVLVTTSYFTKGARTFILTEPALDGTDFDGLIDWLREYSTRRSRQG